MTDQRDLLLSALRRYTPDDADEKRFLREITDFIKSNPHCFERTNQNGHVNGAAWVLSPDKQKVLLTHHKKLNRWFQPGGHSDGDPNTARVALREATEESGIPGIQFITKDIFDIDVHIIPANTTKGEPEHKHYDIRFLLQAPSENYVVSAESHSLKWVSARELEAMGEALSPSMRRMLLKWQHLSKR